MATTEELVYCILPDELPSRQVVKVKQNGGLITGGGETLEFSNLWQLALRYNTDYSDIHKEERYISLSPKKSFKPKFNSFPPVKIIVKKEIRGETIEEKIIYVFLEKPRLTL
ncbi:MAG: hypothetical protein KAI79_01310 [Bacteroidales bacterium]|nr:hypothetical protein [Bacteroidales bacterium]